MIISVGSLQMISKRPPQIDDNCEAAKGFHEGVPTGGNWRNADVGQNMEYKVTI